MIELLTDEECLAAETLFGLCWWCGARDDQSPDDPAHRLYQRFMSGRAADDPAALMAASKHTELGSAPTLALEILRHDKTRLSEHLASVDEEWKRWRPGMDVDTHLPAFVARASNPTDPHERPAAARGLVYEAFHFGARTAAASGGKHDSGFGTIYQTAEHMVRSFEKARFPVEFEELRSVISDAASSAPGANGVFVVIPFVDEDDPSNFSGVRDDAKQMVNWLAQGNPFELTSHVLEDRDLVTQVAQRLGLRPGMVANGVFVAIPLMDPENPDNIRGVQEHAAVLVDVLTRHDVPVDIVDDPELVGRMAVHLGSSVKATAVPTSPPSSLRTSTSETVVTRQPSKPRRWLGR